MSLTLANAGREAVREQAQREAAARSRRQLDALMLQATRSQLHTLEALERSVTQAEAETAAEVLTIIRQWIAATRELLPDTERAV